MRVSPELLVIGGQTVVAALITIALLWYARLFRETERRTRQIEAINEIALMINASLDLSEAFRGVTAGTRRLIPFDRACIALLNEERDAFEIVATTVESPASEHETRSGPPMHNHPTPRIPREASSAAGWAVNHGQPWVSQKLANEQHRPDAGILWARGARWCVALPLSLRGEVIGVYSISGAQRVDLDEETIEALRLIAEQVAIATANAQLYAETRALAQELEKRVEERTRELREAQEQIMRSEKMAVAAQLAAAIAHEINNPLQSMRLYLELLAEQQLNGAAPKEYVDVIQEQVDRIAGIVSQLLRQLYQPSEEALTPVHLNRLIQDLLVLFRRQIQDHGISVELALAEDLPAVIGAANGLRQVCLNLLLNALEAMPEGGTLRLASELVDNKVRLTFSDSGCGIAPHELSRVFDPFYTTKPHGTGLGLTVSYRIVQEHGGHLEIDSRPGVGTTVRVILPIERPAGEPTATLHEQPT
ncbi:MAG: GAF domain-containing protein [Chloroflexi bacterium]|nr:MAG: GAF domain-containing protein [Chloroflexota bacterium]